MAPHPQYDFASYLIVIYSAYAPTQIPIAIGEMLITGLALRHALRQRPEVLEDLNVWQSYATTERGSVARRGPEPLGT
jgi:hypothetical protein